MGRRGEPRIPICFPVSVSGFGGNGKPFAVSTETSDVSYRGACLKGLGDFLDIGKKIEIEHRGEKAWFRVQWVRANGTPESGRVGVRCLEPGKYIWGVPPKAWEADAYDPSAPPVLTTQVHAHSSSPSANDWEARERRQFARHTCRVTGEVAVQGSSAQILGTVTDISLGGCYIEMLSPLPVGTDVDMALTPGEETLHIVGKVRSSQNGMGMGVSFTGISSEDFETLRQFAPPTDERNNPGNGRGAAPERTLPTAATYVEQRLSDVVQDAPAAPKAELRPNPSAAEALEAIARVLFRKGLVTQAEFTEELERLRAIKV